MRKIIVKKKSYTYILSIHFSGASVQLVLDVSESTFLFFFPLRLSHIYTEPKVNQSVWHTAVDREKREKIALFTIAMVFPLPDVIKVVYQTKHFASCKILTLNTLMLHGFQNPTHVSSTLFAGPNQLAMICSHSACYILKCILKIYGFPLSECKPAGVITHLQYAINPCIQCITHTVMHFS